MYLQAVTRPKQWRVFQTRDEQDQPLFFTVEDVPPDGNCLFHCIARYLSLQHPLYASITAAQVRERIASLYEELARRIAAKAPEDISWIRQYEQSDFETLDAPVLKPSSPMRVNGCWGRPQEAVAASLLYNFDVFGLAMDYKTPFDWSYRHVLRPEGSYVDLPRLLRLAGYATDPATPALTIPFYFLALNMGVALEALATTNHYLVLHLHRQHPPLLPLSPVPLPTTPRKETQRRWHLPSPTDYSLHDGPVFADTGVWHHDWKTLLGADEDSIQRAVASPLYPELLAYYGSAEFATLAAWVHASQQTWWLCVADSGDDASLRMVLPLHRLPRALPVVCVDLWQDPGIPTVHRKYSQRGDAQRVYPWPYRYIVMRLPTSNTQKVPWDVWPIRMGLTGAHFSLLTPYRVHCYRTTLTPHSPSSAKAASIVLCDDHQVQGQALPSWTTELSTDSQITGFTPALEDGSTRGVDTLYTLLGHAPMATSGYREVHPISVTPLPRGSKEMVYSMKREVHPACAAHHARLRKRLTHVQNQDTDDTTATWEERWRLVPRYTHLPPGSGQVSLQGMAVQLDQLTQCLYGTQSADVDPRQYWKAPRLWIRDRLFAHFLPWFEDICRIRPDAIVEPDRMQWHRLSGFTQVWRHAPPPLRQVIQAIVLWLLRFFQLVGLRRDAQAIIQVLWGEANQ